MVTAEAEPAFWMQHGRHIIAAVMLALLWIIESLAPMFVGRRRRLSHIATNLGLAAVNGAVAAGFAWALLDVTEWARARAFGLLNLFPLPTWLHWCGAIVLFDIWQYWWHRFNHRMPLLWRFHAVHHADADMDASSGVRFHTVEMLYSLLARLAVLPLIGVSVPQLVLYETLSLPVILFHHSNMRIPGGLDRVLRCVIVTPWMHYVHHSQWQPETDSNYASFLSVWDRLFGSFRLRDKPAEIVLGLADYEEPEWRPLAGLLAVPVTHIRRSPACPPPNASLDD